MKLKTYRAPTMAEALTQVKNELGKDAVILHTRQLKIGGVFGFFGRPTVEITASLGLPAMAPPASLRANATDRSKAQSDGPGDRAAAASARDSASFSGAIASPPAGTASLRAPAASPAGFPSPAAPQDMAPMRAASPSARGAALATHGLSPTQTSPTKNGSAAPHRAGSGGRTEIAPTARDNDRSDRYGHEVALANAVGSAGFSPAIVQELCTIKRLVGQVLQGTGAGGAGLAMPDALLNLYVKLLEQDVARELADRLAADIRDELSPAELTEPHIVRQAVLRRLESLLPADPSAVIPGKTPDGRPHTIALIGPTGVGKTTTVAKLAAAFRLRHGKRVALLTTDTYRIAAVDQLRTYADIIGVPIKVATDPAQAAAALQSLADHDIILVDTAGRSPADQPRLDELRAFLDAARPHQTHLVLSSVASEAAMLRTADRFAELKPSRVIFTKLDEAASLGVLLNVAARLNTCLSFVTTGQEVPDDIEPSRPDRLARLILDGPRALPETRGGTAAANPRRGI